MTVAAGISIEESQLADLCRHYRISELQLFGSATTGNMRQDSDIDLLVTYQPSARISLLTHAAAQRDLSTLFNRPVDLVSKRALRPELQASVLPTARTLYAG
ncbi:MAG: nucleotidyltransferase domain-containing protein [Acidobacteriota bacterium]